MSDEENIGKIKKGAEKTGENIEKGAKKGWGAVKNFGKKVKDTVNKDEDEQQDEKEKQE